VEQIESNGGAIVGTPNKQCTFVVSDSIGSAKTTKAVRDGIDVVTEQWVTDSITAGKQLTGKKYFLHTAGEEASEEEEEEDEQPKKKKASSKKASTKKVPAAKATRKTKRKAEAEPENDDEEEEEEEEEAGKAPPKKAAKTSTAAVKKKAPAKKKGAKAAAAEKDEGEEEDESMLDGADKQPAAAAAASASAAAASSASGASKGHKPDRDVPGRDSYEIFEDRACLLNQTNITNGRNNNKFYVIQLLRAANGVYYVWTVLRHQAHAPAEAEAARCVRSLLPRLHLTV